MKNKTILAGLLTFSLLAVSAIYSYGQAFHKGSFVINLSEGWTSSTYTTQDWGSNGEGRQIHIEGCRDPLQLEYGISSRWGIGVSMGNDIFKFNPTAMYSFGTPVNKAKASTSEFTIDCSYHFFVTAKTDLSVVASMGGSTVSMKGSVSDYSYQYMAKGGMLRLGMHARYFICKHLGVLAILSAYSATDSPKDMGGNTVGNNYNTSIKGTALELGLCYKFKK